jgi:hypothetical protein
MMGQVGSAAIAFGRFWYHFIVGRDLLLAVAVAAGLMVTGILLRVGVNAFWFMPLLVVAALGISLRRARAS